MTQAIENRITTLKCVALCLIYFEDTKFTVKEFENKAIKSTMFNAENDFETILKRAESFGLLKRTDDNRMFYLKEKLMNIKYSSLVKYLYKRTHGSFSIDEVTRYLNESKIKMSKNQLVMLLSTLMSKNIISIYIMYNTIYFRFTEDMYSECMEMVSSEDIDELSHVSSEGRRVPFAKKHSAYEDGKVLLELIQLIGDNANVDLFNKLAKKYNVQQLVSRLEEAELISRRDSLARQGQEYFVLTRYSKSKLLDIEREKIGKIDITKHKEVVSSFKLWLILNHDLYAKLETLEEVIISIRDSNCSNLFKKDSEVLTDIRELYIKRKEEKGKINFIDFGISQAQLMENTMSENLSKSKLYRDLRASSGKEDRLKYESLMAVKNSSIKPAYKKKDLNKQIEGATFSSAKQRNIFIINAFNKDHRTNMNWVSYIDTSEMSLETFAKKAVVNYNIAQGLASNIQCTGSFGEYVVYVPSDDIELYRNILTRYSVRLRGADEKGRALASDHIIVKPADF